MVHLLYSVGKDFSNSLSPSDMRFFNREKLPYFYWSVQFLEPKNSQGPNPVRTVTGA